MYKVKKPVDMGFLDYSTLEKRKFYCEEEVRLNRRLCSDAYLGIVAVTVKRRDGVSRRDQGEVVDYAVKMKRLPQERMMERLLERGRDHQRDAGAPDGQAGDVSTPKRRPANSSQSFGGLETIAANWRENFDQTEPYVGRTISRQQWRQYSRLRRPLSGRRAPGCSTTASATAGSAIATAISAQTPSASRTASACSIASSSTSAFATRMSASDLAFLAMDIDFRGHPALSDEMVGLYLAQSLDTTLPLVLHFYKCYRAFVRGKVDGFQLDQPEIPAEQKEAAAEGARRYFALAEKYASRAASAVVIAMVGVTGSGKSYLAHALASRLGAVVISSDVTRKKLAGLDPTQPQPEPIDSGIYSPEMTARTYAEMLLQAVPFLARGKPVILDASYLRARCGTAGQGVRRAGRRALPGCGVRCRTSRWSANACNAGEALCGVHQMAAGRSIRRNCSGRSRCRSCRRRRA